MQARSARHPLGRFLRKYSIDELPQLVNVLRGDMTLVGPRPPVPQEVALYEPWQRRRLSVPPGLTCLWQVSGRNEVAFEDWMYLDLQYIDHLERRSGHRPAPEDGAGRRQRPRPLAPSRPRRPERGTRAS